MPPAAGQAGNAEGDVQHLVARDIPPNEKEARVTVTIRIPRLLAKSMGGRAEVEALACPRFRCLCTCS